MTHYLKPRSPGGIQLLLIFFISISTFTIANAQSVYYCRAGTFCTSWTKYSEPIAICSGDAVELNARNSFLVYPPPPTCSNPTYQWFETYEYSPGFIDTREIGGATSKTLSVSTEGTYFCKVKCSDSDDYTTEWVSVVVNPLNTSLNVSGDPEDESVCLGEQASFQVGASGGYIQYKWQEQSPGGSWKNLNDETSQTLSFLPDQDADSNLYRCKLTNGCNSVTTITAELRVLNAPVVTEEALPALVCSDGAAGFSVRASGAGLSFSWQEKTDSNSAWKSLSSAGIYSFNQSGDLTISTAGSGMHGYLYRAIVTGTCTPGADTSDAAALSIRPFPEITMQPANDTSCVDGEARFAVRVSGNYPILYKWQKGGVTEKDWSEDSTYVINGVGLEDNQEIKVFVSDFCLSTGNAIGSDLARLVVNPLPTVSLGQDKRICKGDSITLNGGNGFSEYLWNTGDSTRTLIVSDQGSYEVNVKDENGCPGTDNVFVIVDPAIPEINLGGDTALCLGSEISLDAGAGFDWYEWSDQSDKQMLKASETGTYWVSAGNNNSICVSRDTLYVLISEPYDSMNICLITIDQLTGKYMLIWEREAEKGIAAYNIYREGNFIASIAYDDLSVYKDLEADPEKRPYRYEMTVIDTCGNESGFTPYHIPIFLQYTGFIEGVNLSWEKYRIEGQTVDFDSYSVFKGSDSTQLVEIEKNIPKEVSVFIDKDPGALTNTFYYRIAGVLTDPCYPSGGSDKAGTGPYQHSLSNMDENKLKTPGSTGILEEVAGGLKVYPNPAGTSATIRFEPSVEGDYTLILTDLSGKVVRVHASLPGGEFSFPVDNLKSGYYSVLVKGPRIYRQTLLIR